MLRWVESMNNLEEGGGAVVLSRGLSVLLKDITVPLLRLNVDKVSDQRPRDTYAIGVAPNMQK